MLEQTAIDEAALLEYPLARRPASCRRWGIRTQAMLSRQGCAYVLTLHALDLGDMTRSDRAAAEKVYGAFCCQSVGACKESFVRIHPPDPPGPRVDSVVSVPKHGEVNQGCPGASQNDNG